MLSPATPSSRLKTHPFPISAIRLLPGPLQQRQQTHLDYLRQITPDRLLAPYRAQAKLEARAERYGGWESRDISGHSLGHYLSAICYMAACTDDRQLAQRIPYIVAEIAACQQANGDGYALPVDKSAFTRLHKGEIDASPFALNGVWVPFYTLHKLFAGLRDAHRIAKCSQALLIATKVADWLDGVLSPLNAEQIQQMLRTEHGGMNEALADLSSDSGNPRYLQMTERYFHHRTVLDPMLRGEDQLNGLHGNTQIPKVVGLAREFELTGNETFHLAAIAFWDHVVNHRSYANGGHGESEHFFPLEQFPQRLTPNTCETCNTYNMLKLTSHLFSWEPQAAHMDFVERAMINHLAANIGQQPGELGYFLGLGSAGVKVFSTPFDSWWCCVGTGMENPSRYGEQFFTHSDDSLWLNHYFASELDWQERDIHLRLDTAYPESDTIQIHFTCTHPTQLKLQLRHPSWCDQPLISINGEAVSSHSTPSSYLTLEREWHNGDCITLTLPMQLRAEALPQSKNNILSLMYGPTLLAAVIPEQADIYSPAKERYSEHLEARGKTDAFPPVMVADSSDQVLTSLQPTGRTPLEFTSGNILRPAPLSFIPLYRIYEEQYAVYFPRLSQAEWAIKEKQIRADHEQQRQTEAATIDSITPGYQQPEVEHAFKSQGSDIEDFANRKGRSAKDGGWFSYELQVEPNEAMTLILTYWGGVWHKRIFDLMIDDEWISTESLLTNKPGDFFDRAHPLPTALTAGKSKITVRFQSRENDTAGSVYGLRMMRSKDAPEIAHEPTIVFKDH